jgi:hypothetical protein
MILIRVTERGATPGVARKLMRQMLTVCWDAAGKHWHRVMRPRHFTRRAYREYGYEKRQGERGAQGSQGFRRSYTGRKLSRYGHTDPNVLTGTTRDMTLRRSVRATSQGCRVVMDVPPYFLLRRADSRINKPDELRRVSPQEEQELVRIIDETLQAQMDKDRTIRRRELAA